MYANMDQKLKALSKIKEGGVSARYFSYAKCNKVEYKPLALKFKLNNEETFIA